MDRAWPAPENSFLGPDHAPSASTNQFVGTAEGMTRL